MVITGAGPVFSAGFDLSEFERAAGDEAFDRELWSSSDRYHETVLRFLLPTLAAINGPALAGGFDLAILCDLRIASSTARFASPRRPGRTARSPHPRRLPPGHQANPHPRPLKKQGRRQPRNQIGGLGAPRRAKPRNVIGGF